MRSVMDNRHEGVVRRINNTSLCCNDLQLLISHWRDRRRIASSCCRWSNASRTGPHEQHWQSLISCTTWTWGKPPPNYQRRGTQSRRYDAGTEGIRGKLGQVPGTTVMLAHGKGTRVAANEPIEWLGLSNASRSCCRGLATSQPLTLPRDVGSCVKGGSVSEGRLRKVFGNGEGATCVTVGGVWCGAGGQVLHQVDVRNAVKMVCCYWLRLLAWQFSCQSISPQRNKVHNWKGKMPVETSPIMERALDFYNGKIGEQGQNGEGATQSHNGRQARRIVPRNLGAYPRSQSQRETFLPQFSVQLLRTISLESWTTMDSNDTVAQVWPETKDPAPAPLISCGLVQSGQLGQCMRNMQSES